MKRVRRILVTILLGLAAIALLASVGVVMPRTARILGPDGAPVEAWAGYHYGGYRFAFGDSIAYARPGTVVRTDADGNLRFPGTIYLRFPLDGWLRHQVDLLYAPSLHTAAPHPLAGGPRPRTFETSADGGTIHLADQANDPEMWARSLNDVFAFVSYELMSRTPQNVSAERETVDMLARQVIADYRAFLAHHATTPREAPTVGMGHLQYLPAAEREEMLGRIREDLAREPLWGPYLERIWGRRITELERDIGT